MVNRVWHHLFGRGLVASVDNFGVLGEPPTHPELLDYLADRFVRDGWSVKRLIRELVLSSTYRMAVARRRRRRRRPTRRTCCCTACRLRRLEGEAIRDAMLAVSGRLDRTPFGPPVPIHLTPFLDGRGRPGERPARRRRPAVSLYLGGAAELPVADAARVRHADPVLDRRPPAGVERAGPGADPDERPVRPPAGRACGRSACCAKPAPTDERVAAMYRRRVRPAADARRSRPRAWSSWPSRPARHEATARRREARGPTWRTCCSTSRSSSSCD